MNFWPRLNEMNRKGVKPPLKLPSSYVVKPKVKEVFERQSTSNTFGKHYLQNTARKERSLVSLWHR